MPPTQHRLPLRPMMIRIFGAFVAMLLIASVQPAYAATAAPKLGATVTVVVPGYKQFVAAWKSVPGARSYVLEYATTKSFAKAKKVSTTSTRLTVTKLKLNGNYWVRVKARAGTSTSTSKSVHTQPTSASPVRLKLIIKPAGSNAVSVSWTRPARATSLTLYGSYDKVALGSAKTRFSINIPVTTSARVLTIPANFRTAIGEGTANAVYVNARIYNGKSLSTSPIVHSRTTPPRVTGPTNSRVTFASYNVGSIASDADHPDHPWNRRRDAVVNAINLADASVVATQELTTARTKEGVPHYQDLDGRLQSYKLAYSYATVGTSPGNQTKGDHLFYKPTEVKVLSAGIVSEKSITPASVKWIKADGSPEKDRFFAWAKMKQLGGSEAEFYAISVHLEKGPSANTQRLRLGVIAAINTFIGDKPDANRLPIIIMGDFNSDVARYRNGAPTYLIAHGFRDAASSLRVSGANYATTNNQSPADGGYPAKPYIYAYTPTRIDYIFIKHGHGSAAYRNQVILKNGKFDETYRGSDHNLQWAELPLSAS